MLSNYINLESSVSTPYIEIDLNSKQLNGFVEKKKKSRCPAGVVQQLDIDP